MSPSTETPLENLPCARCKERGYYQFSVQPERAEGNPMKTVMFCACEAGKQLRQIMIESRLADLNDAMRPVLEGLYGIETELGRRLWRDAKLKLRNVIMNIEKLFEKLRKESENKND